MYMRQMRYKWDGIGMVRSFIMVCWVGWEYEHASVVLEVVVWVLGRALKLTREHLAVAPYSRRITQFLYY